MNGPDWGEPIEYDSYDVPTPEESALEQHKARIEEERERHLNDLLWNRFSGHYGRDGNLVIPIRFQEE